MTVISIYYTYILNKVEAQKISVLRENECSILLKYKFSTNRILRNGIFLSLSKLLTLMLKVLKNNIK